MCSRYAIFFIRGHFVFGGTSANDSFRYAAGFNMRELATRGGYCVRCQRTVFASFRDIQTRSVRFVPLTFFVRFYTRVSFGYNVVSHFT